MPAIALLKNTVSLKSGWQPLLDIKKHCTLKKIFHAVKHSNLQNTTTTTSQSFLFSCYFTKSFVHLSVIAAVETLDPANM